MLIRLTTPDQRICPQCSGMGWYYVETPERNRPIEAVLKQCQRLHADRLLVEGDPVPLRAGEPVVIYLKGHVPTRLLVHTVSTPHFWAWVWSDILEVPLQEDADDAAL